MSLPAVLHTQLNDRPLLSQGKVRDIYALDDKHLLMISTDRLSAFDVVLPDPIPGKGAILTALSNFWFSQTSHIVANHISGKSMADFKLDALEIQQYQSRSMVVKKLTPLPIEAIVRGYIIGSGWKDYQQNGSLCGIELPPNLQLAEQLPEPLFTPSSKAAVGDHDINISYAEVVNKIGQQRADEVKRVSLALYQFASEHARQRGIIIADTKFEFGLDENDQLVLMDEVLTPDSSRFWPADSYHVGQSPASFDKQIIRDHLETLDWDKTPPGPTLPSEIISHTAAQYQQILDTLSAN